MPLGNRNRDWVSWFPDFLLPELMRICCAFDHDIRYEVGGDHRDRIQADKFMMKCMDIHSRDRSLPWRTRMFFKIAKRPVYTLLRMGGSIDRVTGKAVFGRFNYHKG